MPLSKTDISKEIDDLISNNKETDPKKGREYYANGLADIIIKAIRSADIIIPAGIPVSVSGTAVAQTGSTTSPSKRATIN